MAPYQSLAQVSRWYHNYAGTFGRVLECWDRKNKDYVAIKIVRNVQKYRDAAMIEVWRHDCNLLAGRCHAQRLPPMT